MSKTNKARVRLKDIAADLGLSVSAVSMALREDASIPAETVKRVKDAAQRLGYAPDPALSALAAYRSGLKVREDFNVIALVSDISP
ncbi:MAG: LacI family DNA-binding transcriptional regulator, partial [Puniceicoccales bacterium]